MSALLDDAYLTWLHGRVRSAIKGRSYWQVLRKMYQTEYVWFIPNDDNRVEDGLELRYRFVTDLDIDADEDWMQLGCSFLEMLIALSERFSFESEMSVPECFWILVKNLGLDNYPDSSFMDHEDEIGDILDRVIWRTYSDDGAGSLFPIRGATKMAEMEIWYQMQNYILELY